MQILAALRLIARAMRRRDSANTTGMLRSLHAAMMPVSSRCTASALSTTGETTTHLDNAGEAAVKTRSKEGRWLFVSACMNMKW